MSRSFMDAIAHRRSFYALKNESPISDKEIHKLVQQVVTYVPSAFNTQSTRMVVLLGDKHIKLWKLVKNVLKALIPAEAFVKTEAKINGAFQSGYGTILFYEDVPTILNMQEQFPLYADNFPVWSEQTNGMHQLAVWTALEDAGFGASLQHYNPLIDEIVAREFNIDLHWKLRGQMPFGVPVGEAAEKTFLPIEDRVLFLK